jgi:hypothetical protein
MYADKESVRQYICTEKVSMKPADVRYIDNADVVVVMVKWGSKYGPEYVNRLVSGLRRHNGRNLELKFICFTDRVEELSSEIECRLL